MVINPFLTRTRPDRQIYLINQIAFSHRTSNNMVCVSTFLCRRRLFSSSIGSWLWWPRPRQATNLSLFQPPGVYKKPEMGQIISLTLAAASTTPLQDLPSPPPLLLLLDVPWPNLKCLFLCHLACVHQEDCSSCTLKSTSPPRMCLQMPHWLSLARQLTSQEHARKCTVDFHSQVTSLLTSTYLGRLATVARFCLCGAVILLLQAWYCYQVPRILLCRTPTVGWVLLSSWHSIHSDTAYWCHTSCLTGCPILLGSTLSYPFVAQVLSSIEQVLPIGCHLY